MRKIITTHEYPPIPIRTHDWLAYFDGDEEGPQGWGRTEAEAIADLVENCVEPETSMAPCPHCFESSGYFWEHGNDWDSGPWSHQTNIPCRECNGSGVVPSDATGEPDDRASDFDDPGYLAALNA